MRLAIAGMGWVTPLGTGVDSVWERLLQGEESSSTTISEKFADRVYSVFRVPESALKGISHPRLRRASAISRFAAAAGLHALKSAGLKLESQSAERIALIFAISNGGVAYTKRFYHGDVWFAQIKWFQRWQTKASSGLLRKSGQNESRGKANYGPVKLRKQL